MNSNTKLVAHAPTFVEYLCLNNSTDEVIFQFPTSECVYTIFIKYTIIIKSNMFAQCRYSLSLCLLGIIWSNNGERVCVFVWAVLGLSAASSARSDFHSKPKAVKSKRKMRVGNWGPFDMGWLLNGSSVRPKIYLHLFGSCTKKNQHLIRLLMNMKWVFNTERLIVDSDSDWIWKKKLLSQRVDQFVDKTKSITYFRVDWWRLVRQWQYENHIAFVATD